jgi:uncharacterized membrane protein
MGQVLGILTAAAQLGLESVLFKPSRYMGPFVAQVTVEEIHTDELEITDHPVETGARITDHAFMRPAEVAIHFTYSNSPSGGRGLGGLVTGLAGAVTGTLAGVARIAQAAGAGGLAASFGQASSALGGQEPDQVRDIYDRLLQLQRSRVTFSIGTGKRTYSDMLIKSLRQTTTKETENSLDVVAVFRQILVARTQTVTIGAPAAEQKFPEATSYPVSRGEVRAVDLGPLGADQAGIAASAGR